MNKFTIGCDPEIFLMNNQLQFKSAIGLLGGDKWFPRILSKDGHACLEDNVAVEFNIPPCTSFESFKNEIKKTMQMIKEILPENLNYNQKSAVSFPETELNCEQAWIFGCDPDYNAWTMEENPRPETDDKNLRSAGGHIHVGSDVALKNPVEVVRAMDLFLGVPSITLDHNGVQRRKLYGKAGAFRIKPYGVEYRTLSNFWIFSDNLIKWAYEGTQQALDFVSTGKNIPEEHGNLINECINNNNNEAYKQLHQIYAV